MTECVVWVHGDCLHPRGPAFRRHPDAPALWVWDEALLRRGYLSLKRVLFIYECLLELPVSIFRGEVTETVAAFARGHGTQKIVTTGSPSPGFGRISRQLRKLGFELVVYDVEPFVDLPEPPDLRRFSRYWCQAQGKL